MEINEQIKILIEQFKNGNKDSFVEIINLVREPVYKIIYTIVNNKENAIDILDEVIYKSYTNLHTLKQSEYFKTWYYKGLDKLKAIIDAQEVVTNYE